MSLATDEQQQSASRVVIVLVQLEMFGQIGDPLGQQRDLSLRRTGVGVVQTVLAEDFLLLFGSERHEYNSIKKVREDHLGRGRRELQHALGRREV